MKKLILFGFETVLTAAFILTVVAFVFYGAVAMMLWGDLQVLLGNATEADDVLPFIGAAIGLIVGWLVASVVFGVAYLLLDIRDELRKLNGKPEG